MSDKLASTTRMSNLPPVPPNWLWEGRLPRGKIVLLAGPSGSGKTFIALDLAARITTGRPFPLSENLTPKTENCGVTKAGSVLLVTPQEDLLDNIRPRLEAAQADPDKITATSELNLDGIRDRMDRIDDLQLVIVDPLSYLVTNDNETLSPIKKLFEIYQHGYGRYITVLAITPMRPGRADPLCRIPWISEIAPFASLIYAVSPDHREENTDPHRRVIVQLKNSLSPILPLLAFNIKNSAVDWTTDNFSDQNPEEILSKQHKPFGPDPEKLERCTHWLYEQLAPNPRPVAEITQAAAEAGFSLRTLYRAKIELEVKSKLDRQGKWLWRVFPNKLNYDNFDQWTDKVIRSVQLPGLDEIPAPPVSAPPFPV